eukprot:4559921-Pyramimonas_sp.AAC.1
MGSSTQKDRRRRRGAKMKGSRARVDRRRLTPTLTCGGGDGRVGERRRKHMLKKRRQYTEAKRTSDDPMGPFSATSASRPPRPDYDAGTQTRSGAAQARADQGRGGRKQTGMVRTNKRTPLPNPPPPRHATRRTEPTSWDS